MEQNFGGPLQKPTTGRPILPTGLPKALPGWSEKERGIHTKGKQQDTSQARTNSHWIYPKRTTMRSQRMTPTWRRRWQKSERWSGRIAPVRDNFPTSPAITPLFKAKFTLKGIPRISKLVYLPTLYHQVKNTLFEVKYKTWPAWGVSRKIK